MDAPGRIGNQRGIALLAVLVVVVVIGLTLGLAGSSWKDLMQRAREQELFWRGNQYRQAIQGYYDAKYGSGVQVLPTSLEDLLRDPRSPAVRRYLRHLYPDPMTGKDWVLIKDPAGRITGVHSSSTLKPFRQSGFPEGYEDFNGAQTYADWKFVYSPPGAPQSASSTAGGQTSKQNTGNAASAPTTGQP